MSNKSDAEPAADPLQEQLDAAEHLARLMVGEDDERFMLVFQSLVNVMDGFRARPPEEQHEQARSVLEQSAKPHLSPKRSGRRRAQARPAGPPADSVYSDPVFLENAKRLIVDRDRIVGGIATADYRDCVAIGSADDWCCTGTLVAPNVVVTAGHCHEECAERVFVGDNVEELAAGTVIEVADAVRHPDYDDTALSNDLTVLILAKDADVTPRPIAEADALDAAQTVRLAGYGNTDVDSMGGYGLRRMVDVPLASNDPKFGADADKEFVAGAPFLDRDSCNGDSGGPAYVHSGGRWYLVGATSRATDSAIRRCGDGGIYMRVQVFEEWIRSVPGGHWS
jgi:secreted trypsin-like serine protease